MNATLSRPRSAILGEFVAWLRRPHPIVPVGLGSRTAWRDWAMLVALHTAVLLGVVLPLIQIWQGAFALPAPDAFGKIPPRLLVPLAVIAAPVMEELIFRGWLTGRPRALWLLACAVAFALLLFASVRGAPPIGVALGFLALLISAPGGWAILRNRPTAAWFTAAFPAIFYPGAALFAAAHMVNYPRFSLLALPMVLPQLWGALVLGFMRMRIGLPASMLGHAAANAAALALATLTH